MKKTLSAFVAATLASIASGQGLLSIGQNHDFQNQLPFTVTVASSVGWDSNMNTSTSADQGSTYMQNGVSLYAPIVKGETDWLNVGAHYSNVWYFDPAPGTDDVYHNARLTLDFSKKLTSRLSISDSAYGSYEIEPDYFVGASTNRRTEQYYYAYNSFSIGYQIDPRWNSTTSYTLSGVAYPDAEGQDYYTHLFSEQLAYSLSQTTALTANYRYGITQYDMRDSTSHYMLLGATHRYSPNLTGSFQAGASYQNLDSFSSWAPHFEGALNYRVGQNTTLRFYNYLGFDSSEYSGAREVYSYRSGLSLSHRINERLSGSLDLNYIHTASDAVGTIPDTSDDIFAASVGFEYRLWQNVSLSASYSFTTTSSDDSFREYDRHRVSLGLTATF
jgi:Putative beta-barrel porin 2